MHHTVNPYYITIVDPEGGINMSDNSFVPISHRIYVDKQDIVGVDSLRKLFNFDHGALVRFLFKTMERPSGSDGKLTWEHK